MAGLPGESYVQLALAVLDGLKWINQQIHDQRLVHQGGTTAVAKGLEKAIAKTQAAMDARAAAESVPDSELRNPDANKRPE